MNKNKKVGKVILWIVGILVMLAILVSIIGFICFRIFVINKHNEYVQNDSEKLTNSDIVDIVKTVSDPKIVENIINFDKESAKEALSALKELGDENGFVAEETGEKTEETIPGDMKSAYDRIMAAATKEEIDIGLAIIKKVDISKVTELKNAGNFEKIKEYLKEVLTSEEILTALQLYNKYNHLL